jgi:hypothetical protein
MGRAVYGTEAELGRIDLATGAKHPFATTVANPHTPLLAGDSRLLVTDSGNGRVLSVNTATGAATTVASGVDVPIPMTFGEAGDVIVGEDVPGRLIRLHSNGSTSLLAAGLRRPYSMVTGRDGNYYVAEVGELVAPAH